MAHYHASKITFLRDVECTLDSPKGKHKVKLFQGWTISTQRGQGILVHSQPGSVSVLFGATVDALLLGKVSGYRGIPEDAVLIEGRTS